ncbi:hypothetical protein P153DRAFT_367121 [Dothidotthia symphoricarpi CBS 119687]|uniref:Uncharacterized protein n=1 Tax=Dothidotthia symphoricarpi CBS 119687 TaxID=1392245 RepID=A0A6A6AC21_9PLEO|nr:uncharacterized protein P153DRAFT_367121 [Dothidotthia symphoricarpi CBS 119687]KAF2128773.1 hypothetical protein P153DRAFT_367121 [Dothidotthia symphoricarpi CBS 119687]
MKSNLSPVAKAPVISTNTAALLSVRFKMLSPHPPPYTPRPIVRHTLQHIKPHTNNTRARRLPMY